MKSILRPSILIALCALNLTPVFAAGPDTPSKPKLETKQPATDSKVSTDHSLHRSAGLYTMAIGERFLALLTEKPSLETQAYLETHIAAPGLTWEVTDSRSLGTDLHYGLSLKSAAGASAMTPSFIHISGITSDVGLKSKVHFEFTENGNFIANIGGQKYPIIMKADMKSTASLTQPGASSLATATGKKPSGQ